MKHTNSQDTNSPFLIIQRKILCNAYERRQVHRGEQYYYFFHGTFSVQETGVLKFMNFGLLFVAFFFFHLGLSVKLQSMAKNKGCTNKKPSVKKN